MLETDSDSPTIEVKNLVKTYAGVAAVNDLSFVVRRGEIVGFLGPNGAGKSTTMRILTGYLPATSGSVRICGVSVAGNPEAVKRHIGYLPENNPLPEDMRISEYLYFRGRLKELSREKLRSRIDEVLELCDLKRVRQKIIGKLSKGTRQRVGIAEAILAEPSVIIMDEPTIGLDPHQILIVRDLIGRLRGRMSVILSSHILPEIEVTCDRVMIINGGRIVGQGTPAELRSEIFGHSTYRVELLGDFTRITSILPSIEGSLRLQDGDKLAEAAEAADDGASFKVVTLLTDSDKELGEAILGRFSENGFRIRSLVKSAPTLEEVFLAATRRSWDAKLPKIK